MTRLGAIYLQHKLKDAGIRAEVLNFGVGAYGMDQAYLRWREQGKNFAPDIVISVCNQRI